MSDLTELLERVRRAPGPDRELDAEIDIALFGGETVWKQANYTMDMHPSSKRQQKPRWRLRFRGSAPLHLIHRRQFWRRDAEVPRLGLEVGP